MFGDSEANWFARSNNSGLDLEGIRSIRNLNGEVYNVSVEDPIINFDELKYHQESGGQLLYTVDKYQGGEDGHAMAIKKIKYVPNKRFDIQIINPEFGKKEWIKNFNNYNWNYGNEPHIWFIYLP